MCSALILLFYTTSPKWRSCPTCFRQETRRIPFIHLSFEMKERRVFQVLCQNMDDLIC